MNILLFIIIGLGLALGDVIMKYWIVSGAHYSGIGLMFYVLALGVYSMSLTLFAYQLRTTPFSIATILPILINIVAVFLLSQLFYHKSITGRQFIGVAMALVAIFFLSHK